MKLEIINRLIKKYRKRLKKAQKHAAYNTLHLENYNMAEMKVDLYTEMLKDLKELS